ncbi:MAG TPA: hypothetical protein VGW96_00025 [Candidatus Eremiobacteraceae bacterium]|nr:hypothetical protein [Candidatus Eremiobacteraceae bacterium]
MTRKPLLMLRSAGLGFRGRRMAALGFLGGGGGSGSLDGFYYKDITLAGL